MDHRHLETTKFPNCTLSEGQPICRSLPKGTFIFFLAVIRPNGNHITMQIVPGQNVILTQLLQCFLRVVNQESSAYPCVMPLGQTVFPVVYEHQVIPMRCSNSSAIGQNHGVS